MPLPAIVEYSLSSGTNIGAYQMCLGPDMKFWGIGRDTVGNSYFWQIDPVTLAFNTYTVTAQLTSICTDGVYLYGCSGSGGASVYRCTTGGTITSFYTNASFSAGFPNQMVFDGTNLWMTAGTGTAKIVRITTAGVGTVITTPAGVIGLTYAAGAVWGVSISSAHVLTLVRVDTGTLAATSTTVTFSGGIFFNGGAYVINDGTNIWCAASSTSITKWPMASPSSAVQYIASNLSQSVSELAWDGSLIWACAVLTGAGNPAFITLSPASPTVWVAASLTSALPGVGNNSPIFMSSPAVGYPNGVPWGAAFTGSPARYFSIAANYGHGNPIVMLL